MEQTIVTKCFLCGETADHVFAFARFGWRESFLGVILRGTCHECLNAHIERIKDDKYSRADGLFWLLLLLPPGVLLVKFAQRSGWSMFGFALIGLSVLLPILSRLQLHADALRAKAASDAENVKKYGELFCLEDARRTNQHVKVIPLRTRYAEAGYSEKDIATECGVSPANASLIKALAQKTLSSLQEDGNPSS